MKNKARYLCLPPLTQKKSQIDPDGPEGESLTVSDPYGKELVEYQKVLKVVEQAAAGFMQWVRS